MSKLFFDRDIELPSDWVFSMMNLYVGIFQEFFIWYVIKIENYR